MNTLFDIDLYIQKDRPSELTEHQKHNLYRKIAESIICDNYIDETVPNQELEDDYTEYDEFIYDIILDLESISDIFDGYERAKHLEEYGINSYNIDTKFVNYLDDLDLNGYSTIKENIKKWVICNKPEPLFKIGDIIALKNDISRKILKNNTYIISGIETETAQYLLSNYNDLDKTEKSSKYLVDYEKLHNAI